MQVNSLNSVNTTLLNKVSAQSSQNSQNSSNQEVSFGSNSAMTNIMRRKSSLAMAAIGAAMLAMTACSSGGSPVAPDVNEPDTTEVSSSSADTTQSSSSADTTLSSSSADTLSSSSSSVVDTTKSSSSVADTTKSSSSVADTTKSSSSVADTTKSSSSTTPSSSSVSQGTSSSSATTGTSSSSAAAPTMTLVQQRLNKAVNILGLGGTTSASVLAKPAVLGEITQFNYTYLPSGISRELTRNSSLSNNDSTVFDYKQTGTATGTVIYGTSVIKPITTESGLEGFTVKDSNNRYTYKYVIDEAGSRIIKSRINTDGTEKEAEIWTKGTSSDNIKSTSPSNNSSFSYYTGITFVTQN